MTNESSFLDTRLGISRDNYTYELNENNEVVYLSIFDGDYNEIPADTTSIFTGLAKLKALKSLEIISEYNPVKDLSFLSGLTQLERLEFEVTEVNDLSPLRNLKNLTAVSFGSSQITDLTPLADLYNLEYFSFPGSTISDISVVRKLEKLKGIGLNNNRITDISPLQRCSLLTHLDLSANQVEDISCLSHLTALQSLHVSNNLIEDISAIAKLTKLTNVAFANNQVEDCSFLHNHTNLTYLSIENNKISNIGFIRQLTQLDHLAISNNPIKDVSALESLSTLRYLNCSSIQSFDGNVIKGLEELAFLSLNDCGIAELSFINNLKKLSYLWLNGNDIEDITPLLSLTKIQHLYLRNNKIKDFYGYNRLYDLRVLDLRQNTLGGVVFVNYLNENEGKPQALFTSLSNDLATRYYANGEYDKALALFFHTNSILKLRILVLKLENTHGSNEYLLKYYVGECVTILQEYDNKPDAFEVDELRQRMVQVIRKSSLYDKVELTESIQNRRYIRYNKLKEYAQYLIENKQGPAHSEMIYFVGYLIANRANLLKSLYLYKELVRQNHPLQHNLYGKLRDVLRMNFAYTPEERAEHDNYFHLLENINEADIPYFDFVKYYKKEYS